MKKLTRRVSLRHFVFVLLLLSGTIPLLLSSFLLTRQNRDLLETQEMSFLTRSAEVLSREISDYLDAVESQLSQLGYGFLSFPGPVATEDRLRQDWAERYFTRFMMDNGDRLLALRILDLEGVGPWLGRGDLASVGQQTLDEAFAEARDQLVPVYRYLRLESSSEPMVALAIPIFEDGRDGASRSPRLVLEAIVQLRLVERVFRREAQGEVAVFLVDRQGRVLWSEGADEEAEQMVTASDLMGDFRQKPLNLTAEYDVRSAGKSVRVLGRVSPVEATGWGVVVHKPVAAAFAAVQRMIYGTVLSSLVLVLLSLLVGAVAARQITLPIQRLAETSHEIASGSFGRRVEVAGVGREIAELADDFNRMSSTVQSYVEQLKSAAHRNRDLFISSIRAFAAAIDAKDPYTRGHSERVAAYSRTLARYLGLADEFQERVWIAALLHDVGKIGVEDRILKKGGVLTAEEYEAMKGHPVIGADILSPIEQLKGMLPAVRWHHESWNGKGYPDGLRGEEIPLIARVVGVADTFDAITTSRPYQPAHSAQFGVDRITQLTGARFDAKVVTAFLRAFDEGAIAPKPVDDRPAATVATA